MSSAPSGAYDAWKTRAPEDDGPAPTPCPVCTGDEDAEPCDESCDRIVRMLRMRKAIHGLYVAAFRAIDMARIYRDEAGNTDRRAVKAVGVVQAYREAIKVLRGDLNKTTEAA